ncbi:hypothetical protein B0H16DRAFT_1861414 [Mycena metata]|uniref:Uncharacterized protein n=1 Tax=Mycena metata TaxID=1033252 RepID=A0AAD7N1U7_9AGAR|nr:hypothetical protein B0H16DRAFT_1861414 [Mycena metata]
MSISPGRSRGKEGGGKEEDGVRMGTEVDGQAASALPHPAPAAYTHVVTATPANAVHIRSVNRRHAQRSGRNQRGGGVQAPGGGDVSSVVVPPAYACAQWRGRMDGGPGDPYTERGKSVPGVDARGHAHSTSTSTFNANNANATCILPPPPRPHLPTHTLPPARHHLRKAEGTARRWGIGAVALSNSSAGAATGGSGGSRLGNQDGLPSASTSLRMFSAGASGTSSMHALPYPHAYPKQSHSEMSLRFAVRWERDMGIVHQPQVYQSMVGETVVL